MKKGAIDSNQAVPTHHQTPEIAQPGKGPLDFPASTISAQLPAVLELGLGSITAVRTNQVDTMFLQPLAQRITVISLVGDQPFHAFTRPTTTRTRNLHVLQGLFDQGDFRRRGRCQCASQRNTLAVDHHHPLRTLAALGFPDARPPFFAGAKLPSAKVSSQSRYCRSSSSFKKARQISNQTPRSSQCFNRRQQVAGLGYLSGRSRHLAPVLNTQRIPSKTCRLLAQGRPPLGPGTLWGNKGSSFCHCSSFINQVVRAIGSPPIAFYLKLLKMSSSITY
jgi:hypothetical protein